MEGDGDERGFIVSLFRDDFPLFRSRWAERILGRVLEASDGRRVFPHRLNLFVGDGHAAFVVQVER